MPLSTIITALSHPRSHVLVVRDLRSTAAFVAMIFFSVIMTLLPPTIPCVIAMNVLRGLRLRGGALGGA